MTEINKKITKLVALGAANAGLATVGYKIVNGDGTTFQARTTTGVYEIADGWYGVEIGAGVFSAFFEGRIEWDIATTFKASDEIYVSDRIDAAVSTRLATSGYTAPDNADVAAIKAKTDNLPADPASEAAVESAVDASESTLASAIAALPSAATIAAAVWAAATRTLSSVSAIVNGVWDELLAGHTTAGSAGADLAAASTGADPTAIAGAVWDEATSDHQTAGSTGKALTSAGAAGDPWATELPGSYTGLEAGAILPAIKAKTDPLAASPNITLIAPVLSSGSVLLVQGDDYKASDGRALQWSSASWPVLTGAAVTLHLEKKNDATTTFAKAGSAVSSSEAQVELTAAETAARTLGGYRYAVKATLSDGDVVTLASGELIVQEKP
jgi:hypothetical protein